MRTRECAFPAVAVFSNIETQLFASCYVKSAAPAKQRMVELQTKGTCLPHDATSLSTAASKIPFGTGI
jgi:hypothetical protein